MAVVPGNSRFVGVTPGPVFVVIRVPAVASLQVGHHQAPLATTNRHTHAQTHTHKPITSCIYEPAPKGGFKEGRQEEGLFLLYQTISPFSNIFLKAFTAIQDY